MSGGGLIQIVSQGVQDVELVGEPAQSLWKSSYRRSKLFALESIEQSVIGDIDYGKFCEIRLSRSGDLITGLMFQITLRRGPSGVSDPEPYFPAEHFIRDVELLIGGQRIDFIPHNFLRLYAQSYYDATQTATYNDMCDFSNEKQGQERTFFVPIPLFFNNWNTKLSLPLIALN